MLKNMYINFYRWRLLLRNHPIIPNWLWNVSKYWSPRERQLQTALNDTHKKIGSHLIAPEEATDWGVETDSAEGYVIMRKTTDN